MKHHSMFNNCQQVDDYFDRKFNAQARQIRVLINYITNIKLNSSDKEEVEHLCDDVLTNSEHYRELLYGRK